MTDLHPNWQSTDPADAAATVRVTAKEASPSQTAPINIPITLPRGAITRVSRQPAAIVGILLVSTIGISLAFGWDFSPSENTVTVHITSQGLSPQSVQVSPGTTVTWVNDSSTNHTLQSDQLCTGDSRCFSTQAIAPGASTNLEITDVFAAGSYPYYSINGKMEGTIAISAAKTTARRTTAEIVPQQNLEQALPVDVLTASTVPPSAGNSVSSRVSAPLPQDSVRNTESNGDVSQGASTEPQRTALLADSTPDFGALGITGVNDPEWPEESESSADAPSPDRSALLPMNPYTVGSTRTHEVDAAGNPVSSAGTASSARGTGTLHGGAPRPITQPSTGPGLWAVITGSFGLLFMGTRKMLKRAQD